ncbi:MAG: hypothetical protein JXE07_03025 [Candidatus Aminicenantes bacterium]|nr:hypothetical protein [Candidatus Aminicenantes bacterium]
MKILKSYGLGIKKASSQGKMVLVLWAFSLVFAAVVYLVGRGYFANALGQSALGETLKRFDTGLFLEMLTHHGAPLGMMFKLIVLLAFVYFWVSIFLAGGILHVLLSANESAAQEPGRRRFGAVFFQGVGRYFGRFFRLEIYSLILWVGFFIFQWILWLLAGTLTAQGSNEKMIFYVFWTWLALSLILVFFIRMILDYARIIIAWTDTRRVWRSLWEATGFVFKRLFGTTALYYLLFITGVVIFLVYWGIHSRIPTDFLGAIWLAFLIGQIFILSRGWLRIAFLAAQLSYYGRD